MNNPYNGSHFVSPIGMEFDKDLLAGRNIGDSYIWNVSSNLGTSFDFGFNALFNFSNETFKAEIIAISEICNTMNLQITNSTHTLSSNITTGIPFTYLFIPKNPNPVSTIQFAHALLTLKSKN